MNISNRLEKPYVRKGRTLLKMCTVLVTFFFIMNIVLSTTADVTPPDRYWENINQSIFHWGHQQIKADDAWNLITFPDGVPSNIGNEDIIIAVLSTGLYPVAEFNIWENTDEYRTNDPEPKDHVSCLPIDYYPDGLPGKGEYDDDGDLLCDQADLEILAADWDDDSITVADGDTQDLGRIKFDNDENGYIGDIYGWDFVEDPNGGHESRVGHYITEYKTTSHVGYHPDHEAIPYGTRIATIAGAIFGNDDLTSSEDAIYGFCGMTPARIMPLRVVSDSDCYIDNADEKESCERAMNYAIDNGADVIIMDILSDDTDFLSNELSLAYQKDIVMVAPVGDRTWDMLYKDYRYLPGKSGIKYPASHSNVIGVGSTVCDLISDNPKVAPYSMYGSGIDVVAPGGDGFDNSGQIPSATNIWANDISVLRKSCFFGTTDSAAFVGGLCALLLSYNPSLSSAEVMNIIRGTATDLYDSENPMGSRLYDFGYDLYSGWGQIDAFAALAMANNYHNKWPSSKNVCNQVALMHGPEYRPKIAIDDDGINHIVWIENGQSGCPEVFYSTMSMDGSVLIPPYSLERWTLYDSNPSTYPDVYIDNKQQVHIGWVDSCLGFKSIVYTLMKTTGEIISPPDDVTQRVCGKTEDLNVLATSQWDNTFNPTGPTPIFIFSRDNGDYDIWKTEWSDDQWITTNFVQLPGDQRRLSASIIFDLSIMSDVISIVYQTNGGGGQWSLHNRVYSLSPTFEGMNIECLGMGFRDNINPDIDMIRIENDIYSHITWVVYRPGIDASIAYAQLKNHNTISQYGIDGMMAPVPPLIVSEEFAGLGSIPDRMFPDVSVSPLLTYSFTQVNIAWAGPINNEYWIFISELSSDGRILTEDNKKNIGGTGYYPAIECARYKDNGLNQDPPYCVDGNFHMVYNQHYGGIPRSLFYTNTREMFSYSLASYNTLDKNNIQMSIDENNGMHIVYETDESYNGIIYRSIHYAYWDLLSRPPMDPLGDVRISTEGHDCQDPKIVTFTDPLTTSIAAVVVYFDEDTTRANGELMFTKVDSLDQSILFPSNYLGFMNNNDVVEKNHVITYDSNRDFIAIVYQITTTDSGEDIRLGVVDSVNQAKFGPSDQICFNSIYMGTELKATDEIRPDIAMDMSGNIVIVYERWGEIFYNELIYDILPGNIIDYCMSYSGEILLIGKDLFYEFGYPKICIDRDIHRMEGNNLITARPELGESFISPGVTWSYVHVSYLRKTETGPWLPFYAKLRFYDPSHEYSDASDVILYKEMIRKSNPMGSDGDIIPSTLRICVNEKNQVCIGFIAENDGNLGPIYVKLDNNGRIINCGQYIQREFIPSSITMNTNLLGHVEVLMTIDYLINPPQTTSLLYAHAMSS